MANQINKTAHVSMNYSDKAKKVFFNVKLGTSQEDAKNALNIIRGFEEEGFVVGPMTDGNGKQIPGAVRVVFSLNPNNEGLIDWDEFKEDFFGNDEEEGSKEILNELFNMIEYYKYAIPPGEKRMVESTPQVVESTRKALKNANNSNIAKMINDFFANLHSPKIQKLLNSITVVSKTSNNSINDIGNTGKGSAKAILATQALSTRNTVWIISQWFNYNRQGVPTMIATANQWQEIGRTVSVASYPLIATMPYRYSGDEMGDEAASDLFGGVTRGDAYAMDRGVGRAFDRKAGHQLSFDGNFTKVVYYDISDTDVYDNATWQDFMNEANMENMSHEFNQKAIDLMSDDEKNSLGQTEKQDVNQNDEVESSGDEINIKDNAVNMKLTIDAIVELVGGNKIYSDTMNLIKTRPDSITDILMSYYSHHDNIDREKNRNKKIAMLEICVGVTELELNIGMVDVAKKWFDVAYLFEGPDEVLQMANNTAVLINTVRKKQQEYIMTENRILIESEGFTFNDFLKDLGITQQELTQQLQSNARSKELANEGKSIKKSFDEMWNRIIEANKNNHGIIW